MSIPKTHLQPTGFSTVCFCIEKFALLIVAIRLDEFGGIFLYENCSTACNVCRINVGLLKLYNPSSLISEVSITSPGKTRRNFSRRTRCALSSFSSNDSLLLKATLDSKRNLMRQYLIHEEGR